LNAATIAAGREQIVIIDSDVVFFRNFDSGVFRHPIDKRTLLRRKPLEEAGRQREHIEIARKILRLPEGPTDQNYMAWPAIFYTDWLQDLHDYLEIQHKRSWQKVLFQYPLFSEYCLYGIFVEEVLKPSRIFINDRPLHIGVWEKETLVERIELANCTADASPSDIPIQPISIVIQSNLEIPVQEYRHLLNRVTK
jgi:hypothetical protein